MNKLLIIMIMLTGVMLCGCVNMQKIGRDAANGAVTELRNIGRNYSEKKNAAELNKAVMKGEAVGIGYDDIDTDGDGVYSGAEAVSFESRLLQKNFGGKAQPAIDKLLSGDLGGAVVEAKKEGKDMALAIKEALLAILITYGTGSVVLRKHKDGTKKEIHDERNTNRRIRGESVDITAGAHPPESIPNT